MSRPPDREGAIVFWLLLSMLVVGSYLVWVFGS